MKRIFLTGYMGSGKSTLGLRLAQKAGLSFIDLDHYIETRFRKTINEIFAEKGEKEFRIIERNMLREVGEFEDKIAEAGQAGFGRFKDGEIQGDKVEEDDPVKICQMIFDRTIEFRKELEGKDEYNGEISWIDDFLASLKQSKYRLQMH